jgi:glycosyltransferase involved in cell wall biosynthesis
MLVLNYFSFVISGLLWKVFTKLKADYVFIFEVSPMTQALPGIWYAKKRGIPCYIYVQDLWPENIEIVTGIKTQLIIGLIGKMVDYIYNNCSFIFTTSKSFSNSIKQRGICEDKIIYWPQYAEEYYKPLSKKAIPEIINDGTFNIIFTGNIGAAQGLNILPETAELIKECNYAQKIRFNIVGEGRYKEELVKLVELHNVKDMFNFIPKQQSTVIPEYLSACDAALLTLRKSKIFEMTIPAKLQSYLACGIPIIVSADGETAKIVLEANVGVCCPAGNSKQLMDIIIKIVSMDKELLKQLRINAINFNNENYNKMELLNKMDKFFN